MTFFFLVRRMKCLGCSVFIIDPCLCLVPNLLRILLAVLTGIRFPVAHLASVQQVIPFGQTCAVVPHFFTNIFNACVRVPLYHSKERTKVMFLLCFHAPFFACVKVKAPPPSRIHATQATHMQQVVAEFRFLQQPLNSPLVPVCCAQRRTVPGAQCNSWLLKRHINQPP